MKYTWMAILVMTIFTSCNTNTSDRKTATPNEESIVLSYSFDESPVDYTVSDSLGFSLAFHKHLDSTRYHFLRFHKPDSIRQLIPLLPTLAGMWHEATPKIDIQLTSINIGYPLEYDDVLTNHIKAFSTTDQWVDDEGTHERIDYRKVAQVMYANNVFPLDELLTDFGYEITGFSIEKVGFVQPEKLTELGFEETLTIPVPFMVWIEVDEIQ